MVHAYLTHTRTLTCGTCAPDSHTHLATAHACLTHTRTLTCGACAVEAVESVDTRGAIATGLFGAVVEIDGAVLSDPARLARAVVA